MTHCRTGCGAEINYKTVHFSSPVDWYDIPMEQYQTYPNATPELIHDCPKLKPSTNDGANDVLKELEFMHKTLDEFFLDGLKLTYGLAEYSDLIDLPQELKMHSKEKLAERINAYALGGEMPREDFDKLPKSKKDDYKEFFGVEPPNQTPEERQADFQLTINDVMSFLQRCTDRFPAPFYRYGGYSQLELFRIFLESTEQYADAMNCHIIQGAVDIAKGEMDADAFTEVTGRLKRKEEERCLAKEWTPEDTLAEKKRLMKTGMDEKKAESEAELNRDIEQQSEEADRKYPAEQMIWALKQYRKEFDRPPDEALELWRGDGPIAEELDALEHNADQIEEGDTVDKEQSLDEMTKSHSQEYFGPLHEDYRNLILFIYNDEEELIWEKWPEIYDYCKMRRDQLKKKLHKMKYKDNLLGHATFGYLVQIFEDKDTKRRAIGWMEKSVKIQGRLPAYDELLLHLKEILICRNMMDHDERKELPKARKIFLTCVTFIVNEFFQDLKHRHLKRKK